MILNKSRTHNLNKLSAEKNFEVDNEYEFIAAHPQLEIFALYSANSISFGQVVRIFCKLS